MLMKNGPSQEYVFLFGGSDGPLPWSQMVDIEPLVRDGEGWVGWDWVGGVLG